MASIDLRQSCWNSLAQVAGDIRDAVVYMDAGSGESLHFMGGMNTLLHFSPRSIRSLESPSSLNTVACSKTLSEAAVEKVVIITSCLLSDAHRYILRCLHSHPTVKHCTILSSVSEGAHSAHPDTPLGPDAFHDYRRLLLEHFQAPEAQREGSELVTEVEWECRISNKGTSISEHDPVMQESDEGRSAKEAEGLLKTALFGVIIEIKHFPLIICPLTSKAFVFPSGGALARAPLCHRMEGLGLGMPRIDVNILKDDEENIPKGGILLAHFIHQFVSQLDLKLDVFTLGPLSSDVGKLLTELSGLTDVSGRSKRSAGLLLIDRSLDLVTPTCHSDSLMDRIFTFFPRRSENDLQKVISPLHSLEVKRRPLDIRLPNGSLMDADSHEDPFVFVDESLCSLLARDEDLKVKDKAKPTDEVTLILSTMGGSLFDCKESHKDGCLDLLFEKRINEAALLIKKQLFEALRQEKMMSSTRNRFGAVITDDIRALRKELAKNFGCLNRHAGLIQVAKAVELALGAEINSRWEALSGAERVLMLSVGDSSQTVAFQIKDLIHRSVHASPRTSKLHDKGLLFLRDALTLTMVGYNLAGECFGNSGSGGPFTWEEERDLEQALIDAILQCFSVSNLGFLDDLEDSILVHLHHKQSEETNVKDQKPNNVEQTNEVNLDDGWEAWDDDLTLDVPNNKGEEEGYGEMQLQLELRDRVEEVFKRLHRISETSTHLKIKEKSLPLDESVFSRSQRSLIYKILSLVFTKADIPGLQHHSSGIGRFIKSGLGRFGLVQAKPKLSDNKILVVFVIGGINAIEICEVKEAQAAHVGGNEFDILLGGTSYLTPNDVYDLVIGSLNST